MPRTRSLIEGRTIKVRIPADVLNEVEKRLFSPRHQGREYGALTDLLTALLREWLLRQPQAVQSMEQKNDDHLANL